MAKAESDLVATILHTARLAHLELAPDEARALAPRFAELLSAFGALASVDVSAAAALPRPSAAPRTRPDEPVPPPSPERLLAAAPERDGPYFAVPRAVPRPGSDR